MQDTFDLSKFVTQEKEQHQYERQLARLRNEKKDVDCIEQAVRGALRNLRETDCRSFVIYGEPQSGKTEMMICLTAKLVDDGHKFILHLLNDSVDLLGQNLGRFKSSGLAPAAKNFSEILDPAIKVEAGIHVVFCKKNASDLTKLIDKIDGMKEIIVVDDEADYASPNAKINKGEKTKINDLISRIIGSNGIYIGVTATPARLDLNNTFQNDSHLWVNFPPHPEYTGQDTFFPLDRQVNYNLELLSDKGDEPRYARQALFRFLVGVAYLNKYVNENEKNYSFLIHTSGKKIDHKADWGTIHSAFSDLTDKTSTRFARYIEQIWQLCTRKYPDADPDGLTSYIINNISRFSVVVLNSERDFSLRGASATKPSSLFTVIIGGNIVSRGVTLDNLLSMYFTRDVKHKIQQDTYIQRARMFGARGKYLNHFELTIPETLYLDWHRCFVFHRLALEAIRDGMGSLVWLSDRRVSAVASSSIDRSTVDLDKGEMAFQLFDYNLAIDEMIEKTPDSFAIVEKIATVLGEAAFPEYLRRYVFRICPDGQRSIAFHNSTSIDGYKDAEGLDKERIERRRGFIGKSDLQISKFPKAIHHFKIYFNGSNKGRLFYKYDGSIQFIKNLRNDA